MKQRVKLTFTDIVLMLMFIFGFVGFMNMDVFATIESGNFQTPFGDADDCRYSKYNIYSNATNGYTYWFGKCYVTTTHYYETQERCGLFGINCYEASTPHTVQHTNKVCFVLETGERC